MEHPERPTVSVVVIVYNQAELIRPLLDALAQQTYREPFEVVVADNRSTDGSYAVATSYAAKIPGLKVIHADRAQGSSAARNDGVKASSGELLLFIDGDDVPALDWVECMVAAAGRYDLIGGRLDIGRLNAGLAIPYVPDFTEMPTLSISEMPYLMSTNMGIWADVMADIGEWDETYSGAGEDTKVCWLAQLRGYTIGRTNEAVVYYRLRSDVKHFLRQTYGYGLSHAKLRRDFIATTRRPTAREIARRGRDILKGSPSLLRKGDRRVTYLQLLAVTAGQLRGGIRNRVLVVI